ncbi:uncharacterized protein VTP21DRAFT_10586 [Calcarisporiella thermophila]|uniref:uncharacterized protein n=1 Tax=Calcarisporiella thermophila TaxID=911321 RepID=UPI00374372F4
MLDLFAVLTKGGLLLWSKSFAPIRSNPINSLVKDVLIEERAGTHTYIKDAYALRWTFANEHDLIFVVAYQKILQLTYVDKLLETVKRLFCDKYSDRIQETNQLRTFDDFEEIFETILQNLEEKERMEKKAARPRRFEETEKYKNTLKGVKTSTQEDSELSNKALEDEIAQNIKELKSKLGPRGRGGKGGRNTRSTKNTPEEQESKKKKEARQWDGQITKEKMASLDFSNENESDTSALAEKFVDRSEMGERTEDGTYLVQDLGGDEDTEDEVEDAGKGKKERGMFAFFKGITGQKVLTQQDLSPVLGQMKEHLINKNVAAEIAQHLCDSVAKNLVGKKLESFKSISSLVKETMESSLKRILTPKTSVDLLRDIAQARAESRPYTIVFVGVNGVGKSTNLSKTCFWLLQNQLRVLIAACDTFRSGAVEQLRVHARNLKMLEQTAVVDLYEQGYGKDAAGIAKDAISYARAKNYDVVLIDTAGRMQDNEPLMRALAKLVSVNNPDKIIFVGEALVGNEAVDQLTKFNQALCNFSGLQNPRKIDGIILTKFDTIDDKVGAALSMTYATGQPILFVGTGQTYTDLKNMKVSHIVQALLRQ